MSIGFTWLSIFIFIIIVYACIDIIRRIDKLKDRKLRIILIKIIDLIIILCIFIWSVIIYN